MTRSVHPTRNALLLVTAAALVCLTACDLFGLDDRSCTDEYVYGIRIDVLDAVTSQPIDSALVTVIDGSYRESVHTRILSTGEALGAGLAGERPGIYNVQVDKEGYTRWRQLGVVVPAGTCHVHGSYLKALLLPAS